MTSRPIARPRNAFRWFTPIQTRWSDNDQYGHINNVVYYAYFDTVVNAFLIGEAGLAPVGGAWMGLVVDTRCSFFAPASYPESLEAGIVFAERGRSSQRYEIGIFKAGGAETLAHGHFVHVYVDAATRRPIALPESLTAAIDRTTTRP
ncbi:acyl-CoA thioesterase [Phreatobacter stygius]|uniref:Acyl-CoA thioesterase n=1 Tax=Phreatobacter stygius TaxID=1940610 RepID=A0A4D7B350_9HYPH|nr:thioesterase family protein [Phreatobacter stygius]QCI65715.1 acyl-CoA thioesterase [Phreatobacter stygius]